MSVLIKDDMARLHPITTLDRRAPDIAPTVDRSLIRKVEGTDFTRRVIDLREP